MNRNELLLKILDNFNSSDNISTRDLIMIFEDTPKEDKKIEKIQHFKTRAGTVTRLRLDLETINNRFENKINEIIDKVNRGE